MSSESTSWKGLRRSPTAVARHEVDDDHGGAPPVPDRAAPAATSGPLAQGGEVGPQRAAERGRPRRSSEPERRWPVAGAGHARPSPRHPGADHRAGTGGDPRA
jgi:hypothetical protein